MCGNTSIHKPCLFLHVRSSTPMTSSSGHSAFIVLKCLWLMGVLNRSSPVTYKLCSGGLKLNMSATLFIGSTRGRRLHRCSITLQELWTEHVLRCMVLPKLRVLVIRIARADEQFEKRVFEDAMCSLMESGLVPNTVAKLDLLVVTHIAKDIICTAHIS
ncbi:hypothetical protein F5051DRAFT_390642 [Lentinula edodes]|nr:hypothetical protein F5051DRAFT_390642 [Lentinula edodes]